MRTKGAGVAFCMPRLLYLRWLRLTVLRLAPHTALYGTSPVVRRKLSSLYTSWPLDSHHGITPQPPFCAAPCFTHYSFIRLTDAPDRQAPTTCPHLLCCCSHTVRFGHRSSDEMCFAFIMWVN